MPKVPDFDDPRPVFEQIADDLRQQIAAGRIEVGTRLPSQATLAERYGVAINTVRAALRELVVEGLLSTQSTRGTFVLRAPGEPEPSAEYVRVIQQIDALSERVRALEDQLGGLRRDGAQGR